MMYKRKKILLTFFGHVFTILAWTKCRPVTKHVLSSTYFRSCFFLIFPFKFYLYKKYEDYLLLIYTFMCMIIFRRILILSFQSHQTRGFGNGVESVRTVLKYKEDNPCPRLVARLSAFSWILFSSHSIY